MKTLLLVEDEKIIEHREIKENEDIRVEKKKKELSPKQLKIINDKQHLKKHCSELGGFVHMLCVRNELLFNNLEIDRADISRLIYLATYIDYNNRQENLLIINKKGQVNQVMTRQMMQKLLKLADKQFKVFLKNMKNNDLIWEAGGKYYISSIYFSKGKTNFDKKEYTRLFVDTTRYLYEHIPIRQHKILGYALQLIPFCHYELNVICRNPLEIDPLKVKKLSLKEICQMLEISTDKGNMIKFRDNLSNFVIKVEGVKYYLFAHNTVRNGEMRDYFVINPLIIWAGNDVDKMKNNLKSLYFQ